MHADWTDRKSRIEERLPYWARVQELAEQAAGLPIAEEVSPAIKGILDNRLLLEQNQRHSSEAQRRSANRSYGRARSTRNGKIRRS